MVTREYFYVTVGGFDVYRDGAHDRWSSPEKVEKSSLKCLVHSHKAFVETTTDVIDTGDRSYTNVRLNITTFRF